MYSHSPFNSSTLRIGEVIDDSGIRGIDGFIGLSKTDGGTIIDEDEYVVNSAQSNYETFQTNCYFMSEEAWSVNCPSQDSYHLYAVYQPTPTITAKIKGYINGTPMGVYIS